MPVRARPGRPRGGGDRDAVETASFFSQRILLRFPYHGRGQRELRVVPISRMQPTRRIRPQHRGTGRAVLRPQGRPTTTAGRSHVVCAERFIRNR